jgi:hypothetical protein
LGVGAGPAGEGVLIYELTTSRGPACLAGSALPCADWASAYGAVTTSLAQWAGGGFLFAAYATRAFDPWPARAAAAAAGASLFSELVALDVGTAPFTPREAWKLSSDRSFEGRPVQVAAIISNVVVDEASGLVVFAAVRNATAANASAGAEGAWERVMVAVAGESGEVVWVFPAEGRDLLDPSPRIAAGGAVETLRLAISGAAVAFCGVRPRNASSEGYVGVGAVDLAGGALVGRQCACARARARVRLRARERKPAQLRECGGRTRARLFARAPPRMMDTTKINN